MSKRLQQLAGKIRKCARIYRFSKNLDVSQWRNTDEFLKDMSKKFPSHTNLNGIIFKVTAIDRLYRAMLYRRRKDYRKIALGLMNSDIDEMLSNLRGSLNWKNLANVINAASTVAGFGNPKKAKYWVFASKYLHFHKRKIFPIFDSNANKRLNVLCKRLGLRVANDSKKNPYERFCERILSLQEALRKRVRYETSLSDLDKYLYGGKFLLRKRITR